ncbi:MAG: FtsX-like permease family protein, partial [Burkholderiales bacterium]
LLLSATGVYGATLFWASTRTREFGVRLALGATTGQLVGFALRGSLRTLAVATVVGLLAAFGLAQLASAALTKIPVDPLVLGGTTALFAVLVTVAAWLPARRAAQVDPMVALRTE